MLLDGLSEESTIADRSLTIDSGEIQSSQPVKEFGNYELLEEIAHGGMGIVYRANQKGLNRTVAIKMLLLGSRASDELVERFKRESEAAASLQHPNIVAVHEVGEIDGQPFFSMDYVAGKSLATLTKDSPLHPTRAATFVQSIAKAISHAHVQGILHRDLKPSNVMVDGDEQIRITDFGLAKRLDDHSDLTLTGQILGSPNYFPPEQAAGKHTSLDPRSDIYSIGAILYELLTGRPPFFADSVQETLIQIAETEAPSPSMLNRKIPKDLETICLKCLQKQPEKRYQTAAALAEELGRFIDGETIEARPVTGSEKLIRWCRRRPLTAGLAAALIVSTIAGVSGILWQLQRVARKGEEARQQVAQLNVLTGIHNLQRGDYFRALLWFSEALQSDAGIQEKEPLHRTRIASIMAASPQLVRIITHDDFPLSAVDFSPSKDQLATVGQDQTLRIWDVAQGTELLRTPPFSGIPYLLIYHPDGETIFVGVHDAKSLLHVIDTKKGTEVIPPIPHVAMGSGNRLIHPQLDSTGKKLLTQAAEQVLQIWDLNTGSPVGAPIEFSFPVGSMSFAPNDRFVWTKESTMINQAWDAETGLAVPDFFPPHIRFARVFSDPTTLSVVQGKKLRPFDSWAFSKTNQINLPVSTWIQAVGFAPDGQRAFVAGKDRKGVIVDLRTGEKISTTYRLNSTAISVEFSPDGQRLATVGADRQLRVWDVNADLPITPPIPHKSFSANRLFSASGRYVLSFHPSHAAYVWDLKLEDRPPAKLRPVDLATLDENRPTGSLYREDANSTVMRVNSRRTESSGTLDNSVLDLTPNQAWLDETGRYIIIEFPLAQVQIWDLETRTPLTPRVTSSYTIDEAESDQVVLASLEGSPPDILDLVHLYTGRALDGLGSWDYISFEELIPLWNQYSQTHSDTDSQSSQIEWHQTQAKRAEQSRDWWAARFHWGHLHRMRPEEERFEQRLGFSARALKIATSASESYIKLRNVVPPRDPEADSRYVNLAPHFYDFNLYYSRNPAMGIPTGLLDLEGTTFDLRGHCNVLGTDAILRGYQGPKSVEGIRIDDTAQTLSFLHHSEFQERVNFGVPIATFVVHYQNGEHAKIPIKRREHVEGLYSQEIPDEGKLVWIGTSSGVNADRINIRLFQYDWENPHPEWKISHLDLHSNMSRASYRLIALTLKK